ncbi:MAG: TIGR02147 family protein [Kofleriaceae bacterium]
MARTLSIDVFSYLSYRTFLRDAYLDLKEKQRGFSYRWFSKRAGLSSPNFLKLVMDGKRNLSPRGAEAFATALGLVGREASFFRELVDFEQAETAADKNRAWDRLSSYHGHRQVHSLERHQFEYLSKWWHPAIRELVAIPGFRDDPEWIARQLRPTITAAQARAAMELLATLGMIVREPDGKVRQAEQLISTGPEVRSLAAGNFHRQMLTRAAESIELIERTERDVSALTVALSRKSFQLVKERLTQLRSELMDLASREGNPDRVIQVNFQAFPLAILEEATVAETEDSRETEAVALPAARDAVESEDADAEDADLEPADLEENVS